MGPNGSHTRRMRDLLEAELVKLGPHLKVNGYLEKRLPNTLSISVHGLDATVLLAAIENRVAASAGAACHWRFAFLMCLKRCMCRKTGHGELCASQQEE